MALTPSYMSWTSWTSFLPSLLKLEISKTPSSVSVCSPWIPLICTWYLSAMDWWSFGFFINFGRLIWTEALRPVPMLVGQVETYPKCSSLANLALDSIIEEASESLAKTCLMLDPACIEMILSWSSSLTQTRKVLASLWKIPLASGHSLSRPAD